MQKFLKTFIVFSALFSAAPVSAGQPAQKRAVIELISTRIKNDLESEPFETPASCARPDCKFPAAQ